jgi:hypothetical protein
MAAILFWNIQKPDDFCPDFEWFGGHFVFAIRKPDKFVLFSNGQN